MRQTNAEGEPVGIARFMALVAACLTMVAQLHAQETPLGKLSGRVQVAGVIVKPPPLPVFKNRAYCGRVVANETMQVAANGGLANTIITLHALGAPKQIQPKTITLDNRACAFVPHAQIALLGGELVLKNSDPILHTVHARIGGETLFNVGLPHWRRVTERLDRPGLMRINCDVLHTWMSAVIMVTTTPFFAVSGPSGEFAIDELPPGEYRVEAWHEKLGAKSARVVIGAGQPAAIDFVYAAAARS